MFKKKTSQKVNICLWNRSKSIALWSGPKSLCSRRLFECPLAVQSASPQMWKVFTVNWATPWARAAGETDARHSVSSQLVKYNIIVATIFMTFRTQIHTKNSVKMVFVIYRVLCLTAHSPIPRAGHIALINWANAQKRWVIFDFLSERKWV